MNRKYNVTNLKRYRQLYLLVEKGATMWHQLIWSHYRELLSIKDINEVIYYIKQNKFIKDYPDYYIDVLLCAYKLEEYNEALKEI